MDREQKKKLFYKMLKKGARTFKNIFKKLSFPKKYEKNSKVVNFAIFLDYRRVVLQQNDHKDFYRQSSGVLQTFQ